MTKYLLTVLFVTAVLCASAQTVSSPNGKIVVNFKLQAGKPVYTVTYNQARVINESLLGIEAGQTNLYDHLMLKSTSPISIAKDSYTSLNAKKYNISYMANKRTFSLANPQGKVIQIIFQVSNDGLGIRYHFPANEAMTITREFTSFNLLPNTKSFLQPKAEAQSGWSHTNPSYEENYKQNVPVGTASKTGWVYPALFNTNNAWLLITETAMDGSYCATTLKNDSASNVYYTGFPDKREVLTNKGLLPTSAKAWYSPWRVITIGSLKTIVESTLGTDLAIPSIKLPDASFVKPGKAAWSWIMSKDDSLVYSEQVRYVDLAARMKWQYCLVDADWDKKIGYDKIKQLVDYAAGKKVNILVWYNSSGDWNTTVYSPKSKLLTHQQRQQEFSRLQKIGVKGVKIDFFNGDGQSMIQYYIDILNDAAKYKLLVNFHGATLPRGWARTYPHLMTTEAVKGFEMITFNQADADAEANHCAMLPFTRNVFDPMDFTPMNLYKIPTKVKRKTTSGFELATSVIFLSGIQHYAESPAGMNHVPEYVQTYLQNLPNHWDDVKFLNGFPGKYFVVARKSGDKWYVAGFNGENTPKNITLDLSVLKSAFAKGNIITDGDEDLSFSQKQLTLKADKKLQVEMKAQGGFVITLQR
jgi:alpha-glucosidase